MRKFLWIAIVFLIAVMNFADASAAQKVIAVNDKARWTQKVEDFPAEVLRLVNVERSKVGLSPLKFAKDLEASAYVRAIELPTKFSHTRPDGSKCFTAMAKRGHILGENLAGGQTSPKQVVQAWMDSKSHRENILNPEFKELGVVYYYKSNSKYKHYWVQHFRG
ncbi:MAG: CAP domain-containing protein [Selenomonadaceae bacterium]|nr:CAP domain-containing protein [Selenomonadaceae bacterium]